MKVQIEVRIDENLVYIGDSFEVNNSELITLKDTIAQAVEGLVGCFWIDYNNQTIFFGKELLKKSIITFYVK